MDQKIIGRSLKMQTGRIIFSDPVITINNSIDTYNYVKEYYKNINYEKLTILYLNNENKIINKTIITQKKISQTKIQSKEIFKEALNNNSSGLILIHNHPSNLLKPSYKDLETTKKIKKVCSYLNIKLYDHLILNNERYFSFYDNRIL